jgi:hypothetical protein
MSGGRPINRFLLDNLVERRSQRPQQPRREALTEELGVLFLDERSSPHRGCKQVVLRVHRDAVRRVRVTQRSRGRRDGHAPPRVVFP